ncbi:hypothetical protein ACLMJK_009442 [Lecanora helva]
MSKHIDSKIWNLLPTPSSRRLQEYVTGWRIFNLDVVSAAREFMQTLDEILFTNVDVSANVISTILKNLAAAPHVQDGLRSELSAWKTQLNSDTAKLVAKPETLLNHVVMERFSMPESVACDKVIGGIRVPAKTSVVVDTRRLNREAVTWGGDGEIFRPERFAEMPQARLRNGFMRFGTGAASGRCLGKHTADSVFKLLILTILEDFAIAPIEDGKAGDLELVRIN